MDSSETIIMSSFSSKLWEFFKIDLRVSENFSDSRAELYEGLSAEALYTSLEDLETIQRHPLVEGTWVDLGCGVGHSMMLYQTLFPDRRSIGVELSEKRAKEGQRAIEASGLEGATLIHADLLDVPLPDGDTYFLYFPTGPVLDRLLFELRKRETFRLVVIESHGDLLDRLNKEKCLTPIAEIPLKQSRHHPTARIFQGRRESSSLQSPFNLSFIEKYLLIQDDELQWIGETRGLEWQRGEEFLLHIPPRSILWSQVLAVVHRNDLSEDVRFLCDLRRYGECEILVKNKPHRGVIRKISVKPSFSVELSTGEWIEWKDILTITMGHHLCFDSSSSLFSLPPARL
jgi:hypothetical protein